MASCQDYLLRLLSRREYSASQLRQKAGDKGYPQGEIETAIAYLQEMDYQSDWRVAESMVMSYGGKYGKPVVRSKCLAKGVSVELFEAAWTQSLGDREEEAELEALKAKVMRKYKLDSFSHLDPKTKRRVCNFLQYRGFNPFALLARWEQENRS